MFHVSSPLLRDFEFEQELEIDKLGSAFIVQISQITGHHVSRSKKDEIEAVKSFQRKTSKMLKASTNNLSARFSKICDVIFPIKMSMISTRCFIYRKFRSPNFSVITNTEYWTVENSKISKFQISHFFSQN